MKTKRVVVEHASGFRQILGVMEAPDTVPEELDVQLSDGTAGRVSLVPGKRPYLLYRQVAK